MNETEACIRALIAKPRPDLHPEAVALINAAARVQAGETTLQEMIESLTEKQPTYEPPDTDARPLRPGESLDR